MPATIFSTNRVRPFLSAEWRYLAMMNFRIDPRLLEPFVPRGTELDLFHGETFVSLVGFLFRNTRVLGLNVPHHRHFEELNLRFYVVRHVDGEARRGVVFIKELAPRWAVCTVARVIYNENYAWLPMRHQLLGFDEAVEPANEELLRRVAYEWKYAGSWHSLHMNASGLAEPLAEGSHEQFITEHYWGYCRQRNGGTIEYHVEHPPWRVWRNASATLNCDVERLYGSHFTDTLSQQPISAFVADGSAITVSRPRWLPQ
jgi:uncharacterized protein YqjF (DUF2071 family)